MEKEIWKQIPGFYGYEASNCGQIRAAACRRIPLILKPSKTPKGYLRLALPSEGKVKGVYVHRLVALTFLSNPENKPQVAHIDGTKNNNNINNLRWSTGKENYADRILHGTDFRGERSPVHKLTEKDIFYIRSSTKTQTELALELNVSQKVISSIKRRKLWKHI